MWKGTPRIFVNNSLASVRTWIQIHEQQLTSDAEYHFFILLHKRHFNENANYVTRFPPQFEICVGRGKKRTLCARRAERWGDLFYTSARSDLLVSCGWRWTLEIQIWYSSHMITEKSSSHCHSLLVIRAQHSHNLFMFTILLKSFVFLCWWGKDTL
jgi:hypothetical protein